jgi:hypothetical protein
MASIVATIIHGVVFSKASYCNHGNVIGTCSVRHVVSQTNVDLFTDVGRGRGDSEAVHLIQVKLFPASSVLGSEVLSKPGHSLVTATAANHSTTAPHLSHPYTTPSPSFNPPHTQSSPATRSSHNAVPFRAQGCCRAQSSPIRRPGRQAQCHHRRCQRPRRQE